MENLLEVEVNEELTLDAGWWEEVDGPPLQRLVHPPKPTMFEQLLNYLERVADSQSDRYEGLSIGREAVAAVATCLRWGSYLAVLLDHTEPVCAHAQNPNHSRIADSEMARINIEASAALEQWIGILRRDYWRYQALVLATQRLPMPQKTVTRDRGFAHLFVLSRPDTDTRHVRS